MKHINLRLSNLKSFLYKNLVDFGGLLSTGLRSEQLIKGLVLLVLFIFINV